MKKKGINQMDLRKILDSYNSLVVETPGPVCLMSQLWTIDQIQNLKSHLKSSKIPDTGRFGFMILVTV